MHVLIPVNDNYFEQLQANPCMIHFLACIVVAQYTHIKGVRY